LSPSSASFKLTTPLVRVPVKIGTTCTVSVNVRKSGVLNTLYNGSQPRLMYAFNPILGNLTEVVGSTIVTNNLILAPEDFTTVWAGSSTTVTQNSTTAPNGIENADTIAVNAANPFRTYSLTKVASVITYTNSIYAKKGTNDWILFQLDDGTNFAGFWFNLNTGLAGSTRISSPFILNSYSGVSVGNDWYLLTVNVNSSATTIIRSSIAISNANNSLASTNGNTIFVWGAQLVVDSAQTYVPEGAWTTLTYTTGTFSNDGVAEFYVDCDGTTGWINVDDWNVDTSVDSRGQDYWGVNATYTEPDFKRGTTSYTFVK
jgi:hypothetical protein